MRPETLLAKFDLKGINYEPQEGGKGLFSLEDQLGMVGITWKESPVGFLVLFVELLDNAQSRKLLEKSVLAEVFALTDEWKGQKSEMAFAAIVSAAVEEAITPQGRICSCCGGSGKYRNKNRQYRTCMHCNDGRVAWIWKAALQRCARVSLFVGFLCLGVAIIPCLNSWLTGYLQSVTLQCWH